jgi:hypothetical protein
MLCLLAIAVHCRFALASDSCSPSLFAFSEWAAALAGDLYDSSTN